jgi:hypothetical protein
MTLLHLHHDDVRGLAREERLPFRQALAWIGNAFKTLHQAIMNAKLRRLQSELLYRHDYSDLLPPEQDASPSEQDVKRFPQRPLVLGDKWDF